tara:strand:+ start:130 stop:474 length:345 start_codon:yes stop_codon:yes gene_type:complete
MTDKIKLTDRRVSLSNRYIETLKKKNKILEIPDYIKIDVDGIEYLILEGGDRYLKNVKIKSLSIEINENFKEQYDNVLKIMYKNNFKILHKKNNIKAHANKSKHLNIFNYVFVR